MRGKRSKQYRKLMQQFSLTFGFRPPYQVLVDAQTIQDSESFKMNLVAGLERTLGDQVKPMITQCSIRHLYTVKDLPQDRKDAVISIAKAMERRRCNHHTLEQPLSTLECLSSVIDPKSSESNPHRYIVASQDEDVRRVLRNVKGVPLIYIKRSVMVMEKMGEKSVVVREGVEKSKFRNGLRARGDVGSVRKRKREDEPSGGEAAGASATTKAQADGVEAVKRRKTKGVKGPNPLAVKRPKKTSNDVKKDEASDHQTKAPIGIEESGAQGETASSALGTGEGDETNDLSDKRKRKRKHKSKAPEELDTENVSHNQANG